jgi:hypothetical protein
VWEGPRKLRCGRDWKEIREKGGKAIRRKKEGEGLKYEVNHSPLNFNGL